MIGAEATSFNGLQIQRDHGGYMKLSQPDKIAKLALPDKEDSFASKLAPAQYIGVNIRRDICPPFQLVAPGNSATTDAEFKSLRKTIAFLHKTKGQGLRFIRLDLPTTRLVLLTDDSFANATGMKSQLGYVLLMVDGGGQ